jgi:hypothetical protein
MKQAKPILMVLITILICCSYSIGQSSSGIGIKGNIGAVPLGIINNGANVYPIGEYGSSVYPVGEYGANISLPLWEFQCNLISSCGIYNPARVRSGAIVNLAGVRSGATVSLGGVKSQKI